MEVKAETMRFELMIQFPVYTLSRRAPSTTRTSLQKEGEFTMLVAYRLKIGIIMLIKSPSIQQIWGQSPGSSFLFLKYYLLGRG